jgi:putative N6-adenine-specific DNA methylase
VLAAPGGFHAPDFDSLYEGMRALPWEEWIGKNDRVTIVRVRSRSSRLEAQTSIQSVAHKAIYERLGKVYRVSRLAETGPEREVRVYMEDDLCSPFLDLSGDPLYKRGWRTESVEAPLRETIAAGLLFLTGWTRKRPSGIPSAGGGTIAIEAALWARDEAPNLRRSFAWETMPSFSPAALKEVRAELEARIRGDIAADIAGSDTDNRAVQIAMANARRAGVSNLVRFERRPMEETSSEGSEQGLVLANPPYGIRMGTEQEAEETWKKAGDMRKR